uniref:Fumarylacetoacetate hydrolase domain-containing protein 2 n=1 Tax=Lygus hesperus TaxID=30085 RepID=A0A0A9XLH6_LYGHE
MSKFIPQFAIRAARFSTSSTSKMRFVQYTCSSSGTIRLGAQVKEGGDIVEISSGKTDFPSSLVSLIRRGPEALQKANKIVADGQSAVKLSDVTLLSPILSPDKIICIALNFKSHCDEQNKPYPVEPFFFNKFPSTIIGPNDEIIHPPNSRFLDWEVELAVIIGKKCRQVSKEDADDYIFGYTVANDLSARDWQVPKKNNGQWLFAKSMDTFCPLGPVVVTKDEIKDPHNLKLTCSVNGIQRQEGNTGDMVHNIHDIISYLSSLITLLPGDVVLTGTPSGVGVFLNPKISLHPGDVVETEIEGIGKLCNKVVSFS